MKKILLLLPLFCLALTTVHAQENKDKQATAPPVDNRQPYEKTPYIPSFKITLPDTIHTFNTADIPEGKKSVFIVFGPECGHCRDFFRKLFVGIDTFTNINFYLITPIRNYLPLQSFCNDFNISAHKNIKAVGRDLDFFVMDYFGVRNFPSVILYDEHRKVVRSLSLDAAIYELRN